eukprot:Gb_22473 [translate_table: standard]
MSRRYDTRESSEEYELNEVEDTISGSVGSRLSLFAKEFGWDRYRPTKGQESVLRLAKGCSGNFVIRPDSRSYQWWARFILLWAIYSSFFTPLEFGFYLGLPKHLGILDMAVQVVFLADVIIQFFVAYRDMRTYKMVYQWSSIALRYAKTSFLLDILGCLPWDAIYKSTGKREAVRYLLWVRLYRARKITGFFQKIEKDIRINYQFTRIIKLITVELYCTHTAACIFYYLATSLPPSKEGYTWIGSLTLGDYQFNNFREIDLWRRYVTSLYFAIVTMATVGYGDIHAVNTREMIFIMIYVSFDMILGAYLIGNMTALIVKGSKTERFRDKMTDLIKYMNRNRLGKDIRAQIKSHQRLQYESSYNEASVLQDIPVSIRAKVSQTLYRSTVEQVPLFKGCSSEFVNQIVTRLHEEFFLPGEVIMEQGDAVDQLYIISHGTLEEVVIGEDGSEDTVARLDPHNIFGEVAVLCNIPQPYTVRVSELCRLLRLDKQSFANILQLYFLDGRQILNNLLEGKETDLRIKQLESDITYLIAKQEAELALKVNSAAYHGDLHHTRNLIKAGGDPRGTDYDGRTALHLAASKGYEEIVMFLIQEGADVNCKDKFGNTPLLEAVKGGHDRTATLLVKKGASLDLQDAGSYLCKVVASGRTGFLKRLLANGMDPNSKDYDHRTPLHMAAAEGLHLLAKILLDSGASVVIKDRWGNTPLDEAQKCGSKPLIHILEKAKDCCNEQVQASNQNQESFNSSISNLDGGTPMLDSTSGHEHPMKGSLVYGPLSPNQIVECKLLEKSTVQKVEAEAPSVREQKIKSCTVFPFHPWAPREKRMHGIVMWVPDTVEDLLRAAAQHFGFLGSCLLTEDAGQILNVDFIQNNQKLYVVDQSDN